LHAQRQLPLAQTAPQSQAADGSCNLDLVAMARRQGLPNSFRHDRLRLFNISLKAQVAFSAKVIIGPELDEVTVVAPQYFP
jgi:hypothetical protein